MELSNTFVCLMGIGTVFIGLICIVFLCMIMSKLCMLTAPKADAQPQTAAPAAAPVAAPAAAAPIANRAELAAAISAVIAEELGESTDSFRIKSIKRV